METLFAFLCLISPLLVLLLIVNSVLHSRQNRLRADGSGGLRLCTRCKTPLDGLTCSVCNWPNPATTKAPKRALESIRARIESLAEAGMLHRDMRDRLLASVKLEYDRVANAPAAAREPAAAEARRAAREIITAIVVPEESPLAPAGDSIPLAPRPVPMPPPPLPPTVTPEQVPTASALRAERMVRERLRAIAAAEARPPAVVVEPLPAPAPKARFSDLLETFMEEKNVRWGELIGGLLIVGSSVALVISFWNEIASRPLLKFGLFNGIVAALFALGFYSERKWKLPTTSRGLLMIATLLVPLNFLSIAAATRGAETTPWVVAGEFLSAALFAGLVYVTGRSLTPAAPWALAVSVIGSSVAQLAVRRWGMGDLAGERLYLLCGWPLVCHVGAVLVSILRSRRGPPLEEPQVHGLLRMLGLTAFAAIPSCGMLLNLSPNAGTTLQRLAPLVTLAGMPPLGVGLLLWRRLRDNNSLAGLRTAGTAVAALGSLIMLAGIVLAWPEPALLVAVSVLAFIVLTLVAASYELPAAHVLAAFPLILGTLIACHALRGDLPWWNSTASITTDALLSAVSGNALSGLALVFGLGAVAWRRARRPSDALAYLIATAVSLAVSLILVTVFSFGVPGDPFGATWIYGAYALAVLVAGAAGVRHAAALSARLQRIPAVLARIGAILLALAGVQGAIYRPLPDELLIAPWTTLAVAHALIVLTIVAALRWLRRATDTFQEALQQAAVFSSLAAVALIVRDFVGASGALVTPALSAWHALGVAVGWFGLAYLRRSGTAFFTAAQTGFFAAASLAALEFAQHQPWWTKQLTSWFDPRWVQMLGLVWILMALAWMLLRIATRHPTAALAPAAEEARMGSAWSATARMLRPEWPAVDSLASAVVVLALVGLGAYAAWPGVAQELAPESLVSELALRSASLVRQVSPARTIPTPAAFEIAGIPHAPASSAGSWILLCLAGLTLIAGCWERRNFWRVLGLLVLAAITCPLLAARWESEVATASAWRWLAASYFLAGSIAIWRRNYLLAWGARLGWRIDTNPDESRLLSGSIAAVTLLAIAPLVTVLIYVVSAALAGNPVVGPDPRSIFVGMGLAANYCLPAALVTLVLIGYAIRERSASFAFAAGLAANLTATVAYLFTVVQQLTAHDPRLWIELGLLNSLVAATFGLAWHGAGSWFARRAESNRPLANLLAAQAAWAISLLLCVQSSAMLELVAEPHRFPHWVALIASPLGIAAACAALCFGMLLSRGRSRVATTALAAIGLWSAGTVAASLATKWDTGDWLALHVLLAAGMLAPWLMVAGGWWRYRASIPALDDRPRRAVTLWASLLALPLLAISLRCVDSIAPQEPGWSTSGVLCAMLLAAFLSVWSCRRTFVYVASALGVLAMTIWYQRSPFWPATNTLGDEAYLAFVYSNLLALALPVVVWLSLELRWIRPQLDQIDGPQLLPAHRPAAWLSVAALAFFTGCGLAADFGGNPLDTATTIALLAAVATGIATLAGLGDPRARESVLAVYLFGLVLVGVFLDRLNVSGDRLLWTGSIALGAFTLAASYLWSRRTSIEAAALRFGMPPRESALRGSGDWIRGLTALLAVATLLLVFWVEIVSPDRALRITAGQGAIAQALALGMLARGSRRDAWQRGALIVGALGAVAFSWAFVEPTALDPALERSVATCVALVAIGIFYTIGLAKLPLQISDWVAAAQRFTVAIVAALSVSVVAVLVQESLHFLDHGSVPLAWGGILAVAIALVALFAAALAAALLPGRDPLGLAERGRMAYVYTAEIILALTFLHIRLTMPWLFSGRFMAWWPLIVMAIAYLGVGLSEWFGRRQQRILAQPLERTGILLPLLPVIGFWFVQSQTNYSVLLLAVGGLYAALAITRKSMGFGLLAALAANGGLWHYLHQAGGVSFLEHPQLWLIPPALCVLAAAYLNRRQLSESQMTSIRYLTSMTIYLPSTADIFLQGVAQAPWLPLVLAVLAVAGVAAGIMLRVRAFLFLGTSFLALAVLTMIWHVAVDLDHAWIWPAALGMLGLIVFAFFAIFGEKRRHDLGRVLEQLKQWES